MEYNWCQIRVGIRTKYRVSVNARLSLISKLSQIRVIVKASSQGGVQVKLFPKRNNTHNLFFRVFLNNIYSDNTS